VIDEARFAAAVARAVEPLLEAHLCQIRALVVRREPEWADTATAARALKIKRRALDARRRRGGLEHACRRDGARWLWNIDALQAACR
jgi:hypothetical protein